jgi:hypothetical protein
LDSVDIILLSVFMACIAVQQLLEILDPVVIMVIGARDKKLVLGLASLAAGVILVYGCGLRILEPLGLARNDLADALVTALVISAGTEGFNSTFKFFSQAKERKKCCAAESGRDSRIRGFKGR